jgi:hypothetical protein
VTLPEKTIRDDAASKASPEPRKLPYLFVVLECARPLAGGARLRIEGVDEVAIGRAPSRGATVESDGGKKRIALGVPDGRMSSRHATLARTPEGWVLTDARSTNGTYIGGERVERAVLADGAIFDLGGSVFLFRTALPADAGLHLFTDQGTLAHRALGLGSLLPSAAAATSALAKVAASDAPVLLLGESGTGKEVTARAVHALSKRPGAFVPVNCGALPETLLESQLFGHVKGSFSGAQRDEIGLVRASDKGTLFLDEIGDMRPASQVALLRLLQEREVTPVGATRPVSVDLRVVAATHRRVDALEAGGFRSDLYARIAGYTHRLAPLRDRIADVGLLVSDLLAKLVPSPPQPRSSQRTGRSPSRTRPTRSARRRGGPAATETTRTSDRRTEPERPRTKPGSATTSSPRSRRRGGTSPVSRPISARRGCRSIAG